jgi:tetratricopeptide (TPR) repeat protein
MLALLVLLCSLSSSAAFAQAPAGAPSPVKKQPATASKTAPAAPVSKAAHAKADALAAQAEDARKAGRLDEAVGLYRQALAINPGWIEGQWSLGTALYELDRFDEARESFRRVLGKRPEHGLAWAFKGLCEYGLKHYDTALADLLKARTYGLTATQSVVDVARYHTAVLATRVEQYDQALAILAEFAVDGNDSPKVIEAMGIATLRIPVLPEELPGDKREIVMMAGRARYFAAARMAAAAQSAFSALVTRFPEAPNVHDAYGSFLLQEQPEAAIEEFKQELKISPQSTHAKVQIAFALMARGDFEEAKTWARQAVDAAPTDFVPRNALGQALLETGDVEGAIRELEAGIKISANNPSLHFALARAYRRAGRSADADREQAEFIRLDRQARAARTGTASVGGIDSGAGPPPIPKRQP